MFGDCHIHMVLDGVYYKDAIAAHREQARDDLIRPVLADYAARGIVYLRDGGDAFGASLRAKRLAPEYGIEYRFPGFPMCLRGRYGAFIGRPFDSTAQYRAYIKEISRMGADFVKLMISGIMDFNAYGVVTSEPLSKGQLREWLRIAHEEGFAVMAHANGARVIRDALEAGVDSVEHGAYMDEGTLRALSQSDAVWVPTLATVGNLIGDGRYPDVVLEEILEMQIKNVARCAAWGGKIALGSDNGAYRVPHGQGTMDEYALLRRALGERTDAVLAEGEALIRRRFRRDA